MAILSEAATGVFSLEWNLFFNKVAGLSLLLKKSLRHSCFPVNYAKFLRAPFLQNTSCRLLLFCIDSSGDEVILRKTVALPEKCTY